MPHDRYPAVAGLFYPNDAVELGEMLSEMLDLPQTITPPKAIIAPHAGYVYSGPVAGSVYSQLKPLREKIKTVVILGPAHRVGFDGLAVSSADRFITPLGPVPVDRKKIELLTTLDLAHVYDAAHQQEHSLEVQLPFLQTVINEFSIVPIVVGNATPDMVADVLEKLWGGDETLIVISSDLSHYHSYQDAKAIDQATSDAIKDLNITAIRYENACGRNPVNGLLTVAKRKGLKVDTLDLRNSGDTAGPKDRVVGYGAYAIH